MKAAQLAFDFGNAPELELGTLCCLRCGRFADSPEGWLELGSNVEVRGGPAVPYLICPSCVAKGARAPKAARARAVRGQQKKAPAPACPKCGATPGYVCSNGKGQPCATHAARLKQ